MLQFSSLLSSHIRFLLQSLTDSNFVSVLRDLCQTLEYGIEGSILLLQTILYHMNLLGEDMQRKQYMSGLFSEVFSYLLDQPNFGTVCCEAFRNVIISKKFLQEFSNELQLSVSEKVALGLALADSENDEFRTIGQDFNIGLIQELCRNPASVDSVEEIQNIILFFYQSEGLTKYVDSFMQMLALMEPKERTSLILAPLLKDDVKEARFLRNLDMFHNFNENEFDSLLVEMESETSVSDIMREVGYRCTVNSTHCKEVLSNFLPLNEVTLSRILSTVAQSYSGLEDSQLSHSLFCSAIGSSAAFDISCPGSWNVDILVDSVNQLAPGIHWKIVMEYLDHEGFYIPNSQAFSFFMSIYARACQDPFPLHAVCNSVWKNVDGQLSFLRYAVSAPVEIFTFEHSVRKLAYVEACNRHELLSIQGNHAWLSLDLIDVLCQLAERGYANSVRAMLDYPLKHCPELLLLGISQICTAYNLLQHDVSSAIFPMVVENSVGSLILYLWHSNSKFVAHGLVHMIKADQSSIIRMLGICYEQKILSSFLEQIPFSCSIRLAVLASQEEYLCLEKWLNDNLNDYKDIFAEECLKFFKEISLDAAEDMSHDLFQSPGVVENIYFKTSSTFIKVFRANTEHITSDHIAEELERMNRASMHVKPRLQNVGTSDSSNLYGYADDIEAEADSYLSQIFYSQMPINVMIHMLSKLKESSEKREQLIFDHVIQNLLDEYRFFPRYPEKQLKIVAILFGSLIKHRLVNNLNLGIALRSVLDALRKPTDSKLFVFGTKALEQFVDRLVELPQYCSLILQISHLRGMHPELVDFAESALAWISSSCLEKDEDNTYVIYPQDDSTAAASKNLKLPGVMTRQPSHQLSPSQQMEQRLEEVIGDRIKASMTSSICMKPLLPQSAHPSNGFLNDVASSQKTVLSQNTIMAVPSTAPDFPHSRGVTSTRFGSALNIGTLVAAAEKRNTLVETPASDVQDKIFFLINNISSSNVDAKVKEFTEILNEEHYSWFAQYMVMKRASIEPNFHDLYLTFLKKVNSKRLNEEIVKDAYENCKVILRSELIKSSSEERSLLKNLGSWLGKFTIGRNQVLRAREIDPKSLIIEAYERGLMIAVIPFTSKILEPCQYSLAYKPPNPWTMAILGLLAEIYALPNLKMNLKFDIEVLFKNLGVDMKKVNPTSLLKNCLRKIEGNPDFSNRDVGASQPPVVTQINSGIKSILNKVDLEPEIINTSHSDGQLKLVSGISKIETQFIFNNKLSSLGLHHLKRVVSIIVERAIKKLLSPVVQRCVPIAIQTTKELVLKDYATESDETLIYDAAHSMVASLAGSLAHVTCKETLHTSLSCQLRNSFQGLNVPNEHLEQAVALVINDNLDFGCAVIQHAASVKAVQSIDCEITRQLSLRRKNREGIDRSYYDANINAQGPKTVISESQLPRPGQSSHSQQQVYEDFVHFSWRNQVGQNSNVVPASLPASSGASVSSTLSCPQFPSAGQLNHGPYLSGNEPAGLDGVNYPLDLISVEIDSNQFLSSSSTSIGATDDINLLAANQSSVSSLCPIAAAPEVHSEEVPYARKELRPTAESLPTAPIDQLGSGISEPLLSMSDVLEKYQIISQKLDMLVSKESGEAEIHRVVFQIPKIILKCVSQDEAALAIAQKVFKSLYENASNSSHVGSHISIIAAIRDVCKLVVKEVTSWVSVLFSEWYHTYIHHGANDAPCAYFVSKLQQSGFLNGDDTSDKFFRFLMEHSVAHCLSSERIGSSLTFQSPQTAQDLSFLLVDVYAKLVVVILKQYLATDHLLSKIFQLTVRVIQRKAEEKKASFNPRPYFRLFVNWLLDLVSPHAVLDGAKFQVLIAFADTFHALQPLKVPAFSFAWLELISHKSFMPKLLTVNAPSGWVCAQLLLVDLLKFMEPYLRNAKLEVPIRLLYKGTLRLLLVLMHDFPEFLCNYHFSFCDVIPSSCIQMRNIILSAHPSNMQLPDPSTPNLKIDLLPDVHIAPHVFSEVDAALGAKQMKYDVDEYLKTTRQAFPFLSELKKKLLLPQNEAAAQAGTRYNVPLINSLILYVGMQTIQQLPKKNTPALAQQMTCNGPMESYIMGPLLALFQTLIVELDAEGCYLVLNAIANQLRHPSSHTHLYSYAMLYLFNEAKQETIKEQITRVLVERLMVNKPHPWGVKITFLELIKNPQYNFWSHAFIKCSPEIEKMVKTISI
ncbi:CCR4-NOT transcription complex subunit 1-like isoform X15 [Durio zibethinus]|uniref:CCR4-NOT transcription complex subunit 1-like isoform X15 n=1 Tax=Durio zibethinus TaxID=66656 RepID=A0A6P5XT30_DURZI|nr:CCR4-NOT transcription complex subunit 1-like isoform X15 [Durio zibethinus]